LQDISLTDRFDLDKSPVLLNGTQALVRLVLMQTARDRAAGLNTAGLVTGYRGSPLGAVDTQMARASKLLEASKITFQPGLNEDLAATAIPRCTSRTGRWWTPICPLCHLRVCRRSWITGFMPGRCRGSLAYGWASRHA